MTDTDERVDGFEPDGEETEPESPTGENDEEGAEGEPDAGGDTGDDADELDDAGEPGEDEREDKPIPYSRFRQVINERNALRQQVEAVGTVLQIPDVADAIRRVKGEPEPPPEDQPPYEPEYSPVAIPEDIDETDPYTQAVFGAIEQLNSQVHELKAELAQTRGTAMSADETLKRQQLAEFQQQIIQTVAPLEAKAGMTLTADERDAIALYAAQIARADLELGKQPSLASVIETAFPIVIKPRLDRARQVQNQKKRLPQRGDVGGSVADRSGEPSGRPFEEDAKEMYRKFYGQD